MFLDIQAFCKPCSCGKQHTITVKDILIEKGALEKLPGILRRYYADRQCPVIVCDENTYKAAGSQVSRLLPQAHVVCLPAKGLHANEHWVSLLDDGLTACPSADLLLAVGSGSVHDLTRYAAYNRKIPFISVPTAASVDGFLSSVAAMTFHGCKVTEPACAPEIVVADTNVFSRAPRRLTAAGVGDLLGKYTCLADWEIAHAVTGEYICREICRMEYDALDRMLSAIDGLAEGREDSYEALMYGLLLSGLAMQMVGNSRPASGCEHHMSHLWEMEVVNGPLDYYHGERVAVGLVLSAGIYHAAAEKLREGNVSAGHTFRAEEPLIRASIADEKTYATLMKENIPDPMEGITGERLLECRGEIIRSIEKIPPTETLVKILKKVGCITSPEEMGLAASCTAEIARLSPYVRRRLTLMRLLKFFDFYEEIIH